MPTACINQPGVHIRLVSERLEVFGKNPETGRDEVLRQIPIRDLDRLLMMESVQISSPALGALMRAQIPVSLLGWEGRYLGGFTPAMNQHGLSRIRQYERTLTPAFVLAMAGRIVAAKIYNQRRVLQRLGISRGKRDEDAETAREAIPVIAWLEGMLATVKTCRTLDELRGYEGATTARYFQTWAEYLPAEFPFQHRSTRPPHNAVNACISFGATLLYSEMSAFLLSHGLDPALGLLHATENNRWSLALDLLEPFRPVLVEALALDLFSHQILNGTHFESRNGGIYLNEEGRRKFVLQYEKRMERQFMAECVDHRTTLRQQLEQQAIDYKSAQEEISKFEPFLIN